jgi:hypothetical protein
MFSRISKDKTDFCIAKPAIISISLPVEKEEPIT